MDEVAAGSFLRREPPEIEGSGYVVRSLEAALWAFARGGSFREGALLAANLGHDADTTGAVFGQIAGAHYGEEGDPSRVEGEARAPRDDRGSRRPAARGGRSIDRPAPATCPREPYCLRPRLTTRLTLPPRESTVPGAGVCEMIRLRLGALEWERRIIPTRQ